MVRQLSLDDGASVIHRDRHGPASRLHPVADVVIGEAAAIHARNDESENVVLHGHQEDGVIEVAGRLGSTKVRRRLDARREAPCQRRNPRPRADLCCRLSRRGRPVRAAGRPG